MPLYWAIGDYPGAVFACSAGRSPVSDHLPGGDCRAPFISSRRGESSRVLYCQFLQRPLRNVLLYGYYGWW